MSSREQDFAARLKGHLDRSAEDLRPGLAYRLQAARAEALARLEGSTSTVPMGGLAGAHGIAGGGASFGAPPRPQRSLLGQARFWIGVMAIAAAAFGYHEWTVWTAAQEKGRRAGEGGPGRRDPRLRPAHRRLSGQGIPELAFDCSRRQLTLAAAFAAALALAVPPVAAQIPLASPRWSDLPPQERQVLAPLAPDWDRLDAERRQKWRAIAQRYPQMSPSEQQRVQQQMRSWAQLTPQERAAAREKYKSIKDLPPEKKNEVRQRWEEYQKLPPEKKRELAAQPPAQGRPVPGQPSTAGRIPAPAMKPPPQLQPGEAPPAR